MPGGCKRDPDTFLMGKICFLFEGCVTDSPLNVDKCVVRYINLLLVRGVWLRVDSDKGFQFACVKLDFC